MYVRCQKHLNSIFFQFMKLIVALYCCIIRFMHLASKHIIRVVVSNYSFLKQEPQHCPWYVIFMRKIVCFLKETSMFK